MHMTIVQYKFCHVENSIIIIRNLFLRGSLTKPIQYTGIHDDIVLHVLCDHDIQYHVYNNYLTLA